MELWTLAPLTLVAEYIDSTLGMGYGTSLTPILLLLGYSPAQVVPAVLFSERVRPPGHRRPDDLRDELQERHRHHQPGRGHHLRGRGDRLQHAPAGNFLAARASAGDRGHPLRAPGRADGPPDAGEVVHLRGRDCRPHLGHTHPRSHPYRLISEPAPPETQPPAEPPALATGWIDSLAQRNWISTAVDVRLKSEIAPSAGWSQTKGG